MTIHHSAKSYSDVHFQLPLSPFQSNPSLLVIAILVCEFKRSFSHGSFAFRRRSRKRTSSIVRTVKKVISKTISRGQNSIVAPMKVMEHDWINAGNEKNNELTISSVNFSSEGSLDDDSFQSQNLQWAQGKAGEDRVEVVVSEEHGWVFVGIYDGFNGPDAPDYLLSNLYPTVYKEFFSRKPDC